MSDKSARQKKCEEFQKYFEETILKTKTRFDREFAEIKDGRKPESLRGLTYHISGDSNHLKYMINRTLYQNEGKEFVRTSGGKVKANFFTKQFLISAPDNYIKIGDLVSPKNPEMLYKILSKFKLKKPAKVVGFETIPEKHEQNVLLQIENGEVLVVSMYDTDWDVLVVSRP